MPSLPHPILRVPALLILLLPLSTIGTEAERGSASTEPRRPDPTAPANPFHRFYGAWTLKDDRWTQNWGNGTEHVTLPGHHTLYRAINTDNSVLAVVDGPPPHGHIFWTYNRTTGAVRHLSSFGPARIGQGEGSISAAGDVFLKVAFSDEAPGTYRIYTYKWITDDEYELLSTQYDERDQQPTGLFYGGTFLRIRASDAQMKDRAAVQDILERIDDADVDLATQLSVYADNIVHMAPDHPVITSKAELARHLEESRKHGRADMKHEIIDLSSFGEIVLMRGQVTGTYHPADGGEASRFKTKNLFVFRRQGNSALKVWNVIYNFSPDS